MKNCKSVALVVLVAVTVGLGLPAMPTVVQGQTITATCTDSDGGLNYQVAGYVEGIGLQGRSFKYYDACEPAPNEGTVKEWWCNGTMPVYAKSVCSFGCADGACRTTPVCTDADGDTFAVEGGVCGLVDCDDANPAVNPDATEICDNGIDDDCDGWADVDDPDCATCTDMDEDGYAIEGGACGLADCDDNNPNVHPDAFEVCDNGIDDNCNGFIDTADPRCGASNLNIIVVGWDGTQRDHLLQCYNRELPECANGLPNLQALSGGVIWNNTITNGDTSTKAGWAQIFTGYDAAVTGVYDNSNYQPIPEGYTVFEKIENHFGADNVVTMFISAKGIHTGGACIGDPTYKNGVPAIEDLGQPWCLAKEHIDYFELNQVLNTQVGNRALQLLEAHQGDLFFALFLFRDPDVYGHLEGENSVKYGTQMVEVDYWLGRIIAKLRELNIDEQTLVYVATDHGFDEGRTVHMNAPYTFFAGDDPRIVRSGDRKDIGPTFLDRYGISLGAIGDAPAVNGHSLYSPYPLDCVPEGQAYLDYPGAPACCSGLQHISLDTKFGPQCVAPTGGTGDNSGHCTNCGNGICQAPETKCNCPSDCQY